ncbi:response regulator [Sphingomonas parva]|uniref:histidine kinase n=1 Tax=Sphingomonas parva TaxID=2555898 RepID=A0A4Y8ZRR3_9SPHN|nr:ATP-binding protein [Sphingomonas parva]TFI57479.1 response regulator [Sphingomonas parva]
MAGEGLDTPEIGVSGRGRGALAAAGAVVATLLLIALMVMVTGSNRAREQAIASERHSYDVMLLTRSADGSIARAEAALGRYVLDEAQPTGTVYYNEWVLAERQIGQLERMVRGDADQLERVKALRALYRKRATELAAAATAAAAKKGSGGISLFYQAGMSPTGPALRGKLSEIASAERKDLSDRMAATGLSGARATELTEWLGWIAVLIGAGAVILGLLAYRAISQRLEAIAAADTEAMRAQRLEEAVRERTRELVDANERLQAEAAERAAAEAQLRQVQKMEAVGQLTGGIAHDFNNMLAVIVGGLDLARRRLRSSKREVEFHLDNAMEGATRAAALTRRLLAFARAEPLLPVSAAPSELVEGMLDLIDRTIGERINVTTDFPAEPWHVRVDTNQLENAILNMAVNARDAMDGQGQLSIAVDNLVLAAGEVNALAPGEYVRISVADTGAGIPSEMIERVFEPFFTTKPVGKGTGLGLSQIFGFARQSGGDITLKSTVGAGTTVAIYLPRSEETGEFGGEVHAARADVEERAAPPGTPILVVEDDPRVSRATVGALEELGYTTIACASGREAMEILERESGLQLIITDVMMPEMTGPELVREASRRWPWIAVLFVTGYVGEAGDAEDLSGYDILRKPFTVSGLAAAVAAALAHRGGSSANEAVAFRSRA